MPLGYDVPSARQRRAATSLAEGGKGKRIPTPVRALARNDRGTGRTGSSAPTMRDVEDAGAALRVHVHKGMRIPTPVMRSLALVDILFGQTEPRGIRRGALFVYAYTQFS